MRLLVIYFGFIFIWGFLAVHTYALSSVYINEVSTDRSPQAVEIINTSTQSADISGWFIDDNGGTTYYTIPANTVLYPSSCKVLEGDFNLNKSTADMVRLFDATAPPTQSTANLIDSYPYKTGSGAGNSYARSPDGSANWVAVTSSLGSWNSSGASCIIEPTTTPSPTPSPTTIDTPTSSPIPSQTVPSPTVTPYQTYSDIFISEVYPYPASGEKEWVELYNDNGFDVNLDDWFIDDIEDGGGTPKQFSTFIVSHGYATFDISGSLFNNDADSVRLLNPDRQQIDGFEYGKARKEKSLGRISSDNESVCIQDPSRNAANNHCLDVTPTISPTAVSVITPATTPTAFISTKKDHTSGIQNVPYVYSEPVVLGEATVIKSDTTAQTEQVPLNRFFHIPFSYSILTIVSLLIKIKNGLTE